jgi:RNA polymerase sigma-70 factor (ECF subfamily)
MFRETSFSDAHIVREVLSGKHEAFATLVERYLPAIHALAFAQTGNHSDADDVAQEAFIKAFSALDSLRDTRKFASWLATIGKNTARSFLRCRAQRAEVALDESTTASVSSDVETRDLRILLKGQIESLDEPQREILLLHYFAEMSAREIGEMLGLSKYAVQKRLQRARQVLGQRMVDLLGADAMPRPAANDRAKHITGIAIATPVAWNVSAHAATAFVLTLSTVKIIAVVGVASVIASGIWLITHDSQSESASPEQLAWLQNEAALQDSEAVEVSGNSPVQNAPVAPNAPGGEVSGKVVNAATGKGVALFTLFLGAQGARDSVRIISDPTGSFQKRGLPVGDYVMQPDRGAYVLVGGEPKFARNGPFDVPLITFSIRDNASKHEVRLEVAKGATIRGRIYDKSSEKPLSNVLVYALAREGDLFTSFGVRTRTGEDGTYTIEGLQAREFEITCDWQHMFTTRGHGGVPIQVREPGETIEGIDIALDYGVTVAGRVIDEAGRPVEGATVTGRWRMANDLKSSIVDATGNDGSFTLGGGGFKPGGHFYIQATKGPDISPIEGPWELPEEGLTDVVLTIAKGASISGTLRNPTGESIAGARIDAWHEPDKQAGFEDIDGRGFYPGDFGYGKNVNTAFDGSYLIEGLNPGLYGLQATAPDETPPDFLNMNILRRVTLRSGESVSGIALILGKPENEGLVISGRVTDTAGSPIDGVKMRAWNATRTVSASTNAVGEYSLAAPDEGLYAVRAEHDDFSGAIQNDIAAGSRDVNFILVKPGSIAGRVINSKTGEPITEFEVAHIARLTEDFSSLRESFQSVKNANGSFQLNGVDTSDWTVFFRAAGFTMAQMVVENLKAGQSVTDLIVKLDPAQPVAGVVVDESGQPIRDAQVFLDHVRLDFLRSRVPLGSIGSSVRTNQNGEFLLDTLTPDPRWVIAYQDGFAPGFGEIPPIGHNRTGLRIVLGQGGKVEGKVAIAGETTATEPPKFSLRAWYPEESHKGPIDIPCEPDGTYIYDRLAPGLVELTASLAYGSPANGAAQSIRRSIVIEEGETTTEDFGFQCYDAVLEGTVTSEGHSISRVSLIAEYSSVDGDTESFHAIADADGNYRIEGIPAGTLKVIARAVTDEGDAVYDEINIESTSGETTRYDFTL